MRRIKICNLSLIGICALTLVTASSATAEEAGNPLFLPNPKTTEPLTFVATSKAGEFRTAGIAIRCESDEVRGEFKEARLGTSTINFKECEASKVSCKSLGDLKGTILVKVGLRLVDDLNTHGEFNPGLLMLLASLAHIECGTVLLLVGGSAIGEFLGVGNGTVINEGELVSLAFVFLKESEQTPKTCMLPKETCKGNFEPYGEIEGTKKQLGLATEETVSFSNGTKQVKLDF